MFRKKPQIKTLSPLRSSDRRKLADKIIDDYHLLPGDSAEHADGKQQDDQANTRSALRKSLLPDNALSAKFTTTSGPALKEVSGYIYVGSFSTGEQRVLWIRIGETIYPTVYSLWRRSDLLPLLHTPSLVVEKLNGGADLMIPGLAGPPFPSMAKKGSVVAVASLDSPTVPLVVGTCLIDVSAVKKTQGEKGQAVETFHCTGDELWDWSTSGRAGTSPPSQLQGGFDTDEILAEATIPLAVIDEDDADGGVSLDPESHSRRAQPTQPGDGLAEIVDVAATLSTKEIDDTFWKAFLFGVHHAIHAHGDAPKYGFDFPLNQSVFMSDVVLPYLPVNTPEYSQVLQMKRTSWKNTRKFIKALDKSKLILSKEGKNESMVLDIDFEDQAFKSFQPYPLPKKDANTSIPAAGAAPTAPAADSIDDSIGQRLKVCNLYRPRDIVAPFFKSNSSPKLSHYSAAEVKAAVIDHVQSSGLIVPTNKRQVKLDPVISNAVLTDDSKGDHEILTKGTVARDILVERVLSACVPAHLILRNEEMVETTSQKPKAGVAPKVGIQLETRGGNKTATRVFGLEPFSIKPQPLADELRKTCAGSTSVEPFKGGKGMEVMVQGAQADAVAKALSKRGINRAWIELIDKTKKK